MHPRRSVDTWSILEHTFVLLSRFGGLEIVLDTQRNPGVTEARTKLSLSFT